jgi:hypothetical protein
MVSSRGATKGSRVFAAEPVCVQKKPKKRGTTLSRSSLRKKSGVQPIKLIGGHPGQKPMLDSGLQESPQFRRQNEDDDLSCSECTHDSSCSLCSLFTDPLQDFWVTMKSRIVMDPVAMKHFTLHDLRLDANSIILL